MNRYLVFAYHDYYPSGGWGDFVSAYDKLEDAKDAAKLAGGDYREVVDVEIL